MKNRRKSACANLLGLSAAAALMLPSVAGADMERGRLLYENHCMFCHASTVHVRDQRKTRTPAELRARIQQWSGELKLHWQENDVNDVFLYLNNRYYRFAPEAAPR
jgi:cytochrome c5